MNISRSRYNWRLFSGARVDLKTRMNWLAGCTPVAYVYYTSMLEIGSNHSFNHINKGGYKYYILFNNNKNIFLKCQFNPLDIAVCLQIYRKHSHFLILNNKKKAYTPRTKENNRSIYRRTEINQKKRQITFLQRCLLEGLPMPRN